MTEEAGTEATAKVRVRLSLTVDVEVTEPAGNTLEEVKRRGHVVGRSHALKAFEHVDHERIRLVGELDAKVVSFEVKG